MGLGRVNFEPKALAPGTAGALRSLEDLRYDAGTDRAAAFANGETQTFFARDRRDQVISMSMLSPGITISTPSGSLMLPVTSVVRK